MTPTKTHRGNDMKKVTIILALLLLSGALVSRANAIFNFSSQADNLSAEEIMGWLGEHSPEITSDLNIIKEIAPEIYFEVLEDAAMEIPEGEALRLSDPDLFKAFLRTDELEIRSIRLAVQLAVEKDAKKQETLRSEIKSLVTTVFNQRLEQHQLVVSEIERELEELKKMGTIRKQNKQKVIDARYHYLIDPNSEALEWW